VTFSVVTAVWNRAGLLPHALDSLRAQTCADWEGLVVDDGSTDGTPAVVTPWLCDPRFRLLERPHRGLSAARNAGIAEARGEWITFLDSDDVYESDHLEQRLRFIAAHPEVEVIHGGYRVIGPPGTHFVPDARDPGRLIPIADCVVGATLVVRASLLREVGGFPDVPYAMDYHLMETLRGRTVVGECPSPTYLYHRRIGEGMCEEGRP
jgi:glycosyltransferase involved in cell wall biosynthesis